MVSMPPAPTDLALVRLLQLASPTLPVGAYSYSQGLEQAIACGIVADRDTLARWIGDVLEFSLARWEAPLVARLLRAWRVGDANTVLHLDARFVASRETAELRAETLQMGHSLARLLAGSEALATAEVRTVLREHSELSYPATWSAAAACASVDESTAVQTYLWSWLENQVLAALKAMPLGQSAGQRLLADLGARIPALAASALACDEREFGNWTPGLALASAAHETQYSRLFRS